MKFRTERDPLGELQVPADAYYGVHTLRALENFSISGTPISIYPELVTALACVKQAAALANNELGLLEEEDAPKHQLRAALRIFLRVGERKGGAPASAEDHPFVDLRDLGAQLLDVVDEVPRRVRFEARIRRRLAAASLVEDEDLVLLGIPLAPMVGTRSAAGTAVEHHCRLAIRVARQFPVEAVSVADVEVPGLVRLEVRIEGPALARVDVPQKLNSS